jgi:deoxyribodipyrimidine photolyase-related protein
MASKKPRGEFARRLEASNPDPSGRRWLFVPYDQLSDRIGPLSREDPETLGIVLVESPWKAARRPYHKQKLALILSNLRHFALEQAARGVAVRHLVARGPYREALAAAVAEPGLDAPLRVMVPAERELRTDLEPLRRQGVLEQIPHEGWLTSRDQFDRSQNGPPWRMDAFYRLVRRESGILMKNDKPVGGKFSFDRENRKPWKGDPPAPDLPRFGDDPVKSEVVELIEGRYGAHPGRLDPDRLPATAEDARKAWRWARRNCLPHFGPFEDAMSVRSSNLFHTRISPLLHLHRLPPRDVVRDVSEMEIPLASKEGFVRQVLGWREFVRHVHLATDGFRELPGGPAATGDEAGATPSFLGASEPLPAAYWGEPSGLECLDRVVADVWREGQSHHITRLMVLSNLATLLDLSPRELTDWFWVAYVDAFDWVVEPNVLGMGTFATGELMTTKPYVSGAAYIDRMSDYCAQCVFSPRENCPITPLYWAFLARHEQALRDHPRMRMPLASLGKRAPAQRRRDERTFELVRRALREGRRLTPSSIATLADRPGGGRSC